MRTVEQATASAAGVRGDSERLDGASQSARDEVENPLRMLIVDDDPSIRRYLVKLSTVNGLDVVTADSVDEALLVLGQQETDVVLTDLNLDHGGEGIRLLEQIREKHVGLPVVLMSGKPTVDSAMQAVELRAFAYLKKPFTSEEVLDTVQTAGRYYRISKAEREAALAADGSGELDAKLDRAMSSLWMAFQPLIDTRWEVVGYEALVRNEEPELRNPPDLFDAAFEVGRADELSHRIWELAVEPFNSSTKGELLFLNVDPRQLAADPLIPPEHPLMGMAKRVVLEITERASATHLDQLQKIAECRSQGFRVAVDDLGVGYSGLTAFAQIEPEYIKIDGSLIQKIDQHEPRQKLIRSVTSLANELGITVVAEGIERIEEFEVVRDLGAHMFQGFFVGKPEPWSG